MAKGLSVHVGLNAVDPTHYADWAGPLAACEFDARDMESIARANGFQPTVLRTTEATAEAVTDVIRAAATELKSGDILFLSYSGAWRANRGLERRRGRPQGRDLVLVRPSTDRR